ncbi:MAG: MFS transporter [Desulfobacterales bacterium]|nr:MFS transporter [Desulfobacterales bacterium]MDD4071791.1 MFS transporter [Desulfobacterales bacterium]MDD4393411.1 MFS transporter [Desulfobacterales bacterium]
MKHEHSIGLETSVFCLVAATFTTIYITQPVLPVLQAEFGVSETMASLSISVVVLGIALSTLPFGKIADLFPLKPIILIGGTMVTACGLLCAATRSLPLLIAARFIQGLFLPSLSSCLAAYLGRSLPPHRLNVVMGCYVSATVAGGLGGRLLGGWIHPPLHWRYAFITASILLFIATVAAVKWLPGEESNAGKAAEDNNLGFIKLLSRYDLLRLYSVGFGSFFVFSSVFNYLPFYLAGSDFNASTRLITMMYLSYIIGVIMGPVAGNISNRFGNGPTMALGAVAFGLSLFFTLIHSIAAIILSLAGICAGFFAIHSTAVGALNLKLSCSRGRANSLYVLFYYLGGYTGITISGYVYVHFEWIGVVLLGAAMLMIPLGTGIIEMYKAAGSGR